MKNEKQRNEKGKKIDALYSRVAVFTIDHSPTPLHIILIILLQFT